MLLYFDYETTLSIGNMLNILSDTYLWIYFVTVRCSLIPAIKNQAKEKNLQRCSLGIIILIWIDVWRRYMGWWWICWILQGLAAQLLEEFTKQQVYFISEQPFLKKNLYMYICVYVCVYLLIRVLVSIWKTCHYFNDFISRM